MDKILPSIARGLAERGSGRGDFEMWRRDEDWSGEVKLGTSTVAVDVVDVDEAVEVVGDGKGSWTERLRTWLQLGSHLQEKGGVFPYIPAVRLWALQ